MLGENEFRPVGARVGAKITTFRRSCWAKISFDRTDKNTLQPALFCDLVLGSVTGRDAVRHVPSCRKFTAQFLELLYHSPLVRAAPVWYPSPEEDCIWC